MLPKNICLGIMFLIVTTAGTVANLFLFTFYMLNILGGHKKSSITLIFAQLSLVNSTMLLIKGIPQTLQGLTWNYFLDDAGCKIVFYLRTLSQGLSISFTCLLCIFQAITISPPNSRWADFKVTLTQQTKSICLFSWILNLFIEIPVFVNARGPRSNNITKAFDGVFCTAELIMDFYLIITTFRNVLCLGIMVLASGYMVFLLHRHHQQVQNFQTTKLSPKRHPEIRATQIILLLMITFVSFYAITNNFTLFLSYSDQTSPWMLPTAVFLSLCYPTISPFMLIPRVPRPPCIIWTKKDTHSVASRPARGCKGEKIEIE
ncbi:vomeronasal 1 receptor monDomV1R1217 [Monodelphis domestica]|uniref:vomeronasal 1 receptor monDomV1R1217 n=1 Tax=Monodelphis domestica TaxID=13616 RepID=UPI0001C4795E|nr:vomeronasal 1 receptor monDomV1R1217 [Monodelphis domestica]